MTRHLPSYADLPLLSKIEPPTLEGRRRLLKLMAASAALTGAGCSEPPAEQILPYVSMPERTIPGHPVFYASTLVRNGYGMGVLVETNMGRPTKIEGNPLHPASLGATDIYAQAAILQLWDPERSRVVLHESALSTWPAFQQAMRQRLGQSGNGAGVRLLTGTVTSPSLIAAIEAVRQRYPEMRWHRHDPTLDNAESAAKAHVFGNESATATYRLDRVQVALSLDADIFSDGVESLSHARHFMAGRGEAIPRKKLYAVEATPGLCGAAADSRLAMPPREIEALLYRLAVKLGLLNSSPDTTAGPPPDKTIDDWENALARYLNDHHGASLIVAGASLSVQAHILAWRLNHHLGNIGETILVRSIAAPTASLGDLVRDMRDGAVDTLFMLGVNPVYDTPASLGFAQRLKQLPCSVHMGFYRDETAHVATWHIPQCHELESWGDALSPSGVASIIQPVTAPLYAGHTPYELMGLMSGNELSAYDQLRQYWQDAWQEPALAAFESRWHQALRQGVVQQDSEPALLPVIAPDTDTANDGRQPDSDAGLTAIFVLDSAVQAGEFSNNAWLQELPRPFSKITWDNAVLMGPHTAQEHGVTTGDIVNLATLDKKHTVHAPVYVLPGHAERCVSLPMGYGRNQLGAVADGVGFNACIIQAMGRHGPEHTARITLEPLGKQHPFATTQRHHQTEGRQLIRTVAPGQTLEDAAPTISLYPDHDYTSYAWGMTIDLDSCIGCNACAIACQAENNIPVVGKEEIARGREMHWIRIDHYREDSNDIGAFQPVACQHCENAPCELVCPVGATMHDNEGLNVQVYNRCVGTRFCSNNCPYKARRFNFFQYAETEQPSSRARQNPEVTVRQRGVMEKCTYCVQRISRARISAQKDRREIRDQEVVTACEAVCPTQAITFGDLNDPNSRVSMAKKSPRNYDLLGELNTRPRTSYLARVDDSSNPEGDNHG